MASGKLEDYLTLVTIRQTAKRRDTLIAGGVFLISLMATITLGMLDRINMKSFFLVSVMLMGFGFAFLASWIKLEIIKGSIELIDNLLLMSER